MLLLQTVSTAVSNAIPVTDPGIHTSVDAFAHQAGLVAITVWAIQMLKRSRLFPWLNANSQMTTRVVSTAAALGSALAVQISVTGDAGHGWVMSIPSAHVLWDSVIRFCGQKMGQETLYKLVYKEPQEVTPVPPPLMDQGGKPVEIRKD